MVHSSSFKLSQGQGDVISMDTEEDEVPENAATMNELIDTDSFYLPNHERIVPKFSQSNTMTSLLDCVIPEHSDAGKLQDIKTEAAAKSFDEDLEFQHWALKTRVAELEENLRMEKSINAQYSSLCDQLYEELYKKDPNFWGQSRGPSSDGNGITGVGQVSSANNSGPVRADFIPSVKVQDVMPSDKTQELIQPVKMNSGGIFVASTISAGPQQVSKQGKNLQLVNATELLEKIHILQQDLSNMRNEKTEFVQLSQQLCQKWVAHEEEIYTMNPILWLHFDSIVQSMLGLTAPVLNNPEVKVDAGQDSSVSSSCSSGGLPNGSPSPADHVNHDNPSGAQGSVRVRTKSAARRQQFKCEICGVVYKYPGSLHHHMKTHSLPNRGQVACSFCGIKVARGYSLTRHQKSSQCMKARELRNAN